MPLDGSAGHGNTTAVKQQHFATVLRTHLAATGAIIAKHKSSGWSYHPQYVYFDLTAGSGVVGGHVGSPLIFLRTATEMGISFDAHFFEEDPKAVTALIENVELLQAELGQFSGRVSIWAGDSNELIVAAIMKVATKSLGTFGLAYMDPNGHKVPIKAMTAITSHPKFKKLDVLVHVAGTAYKRVAGSLKLDVAFSRDIRQAGKKLILIRDPIGAWQWTFALMSNWVNMPKFKSIGFHEAAAPDGEAVERRINEPLPKEPCPTRPMPSTSAIPSSSPSALSSSSGPAVTASAVAYDRQPSHTISSIRPGEPSTFPRTCLPSATAATASFTGNPIEDGWCFGCGGSPFCTACNSPRHLGYGNGRLLCWCDEPVPATCHDCRPDLHTEDERWFDH